MNFSKILDKYSNFYAEMKDLTLKLCSSDRVYDVNENSCSFLLRTVFKNICSFQNPPAVRKSSLDYS